VVRPVVWRPPAEPSPAEQAVIKAVRRAKLFVFLRLHRHELFDEGFQTELARAYADRPKGQPPVPPAQLALATVLQAYTGVSDDEVIEATLMDRRWQLVLDCLGAEEPPFSKGTLVGFRTRLIERDLDRRLVERTVELAAATGGFGARALRAALDSSPLWGAGRVEDTFNLMGHALRKALGVIAVLQGWGQAAGTAMVAAQAGVPQLAASSLKAALDADWDDPAARDQALAWVLGLLDQVEAFTAGQFGDAAAVAAVAVACQVRDQDVDLTGPAPALRRGVAKDRRISVEDGDMRHGRKSRSVRVRDVGLLQPPHLLFAQRQMLRTENDHRLPSRARHAGRRPDGPLPTRGHTPLCTRNTNRARRGGTGEPLSAPGTQITHPSPDPGSPPARRQAHLQSVANQSSV
jgi:hypothetical protein